MDNKSSSFWDSLFEFLAILMPNLVTILWIITSDYSNVMPLLFGMAILGTVFAYAHFFFNRKFKLWVALVIIIIDAALLLWSYWTKCTILFVISQTLTLILVCVGGFMLIKNK
ncbi:hypothetical protein MUDAN_BIHEEGNE_03206 [Lactiplantibacillus mudanjiangensis]|uniref:hypothetical protein n=1 Tax=Lactiplantibacillus mudanjiangensis TaxID=1296538 RepID=UPI0010144C0F|nr:hypothetical protein MUDAN_BIHEEGNE_03206 [Lactiplantibacillus mudanjiangensis]